jgi:hypothetical protein
MEVSESYNLFNKYVTALCDDAATVLSVLLQRSRSERHGRSR